MKVTSTKDIAIPTNPLDRVIGQDEAVAIARIAAKQRRHLLLVGAPGTGKSMVAQAVASLLPKPKFEVSVLHNPENPERPFVEITPAEKAKERKQTRIGRVVEITDVPVSVAERLGYRCKRCGSISPSGDFICPSCGANKYSKANSPFDDMLFAAGERREDKVKFTWKSPEGFEGNVIYMRGEGNTIIILTEAEYSKLDELSKKKLRKVLLPISRPTFVQATGASETELLGDVKHDPYGGHPEAGIQPYLRVVPGAVHEAHEGVLFVDEISTLGRLQRFLLTAMQEKRFPITGRNQSSTGAAVRVDAVPCDFILVAALNTNDLPSILPPLRSRIRGDGYEVLLSMTMPDNVANREKLTQFVAQEIKKDGKIPHASMEAVEEIINESKLAARHIDDTPNALSLRLRGLAGIIKLAGDFAVVEDAPLIEKEHVKKAKTKSASIEEQINKIYGSWWKAGMSDYGNKTTASSEIA